MGLASIRALHSASYGNIIYVLFRFFRFFFVFCVLACVVIIFLFLYLDIPKELRLQAMQLAIILMPDENRDVLQTLLLFLNEVASHSYVNQMSEKNLATCFVPAFFHLCGGVNKIDKLANTAPKKLKRSLSVQYQKELDDTMVSEVSA